MKSLREYLDQLDEISRRDFLKGAGAAAGLAAADAVAAPWMKSQHTDPMTDKVLSSVHLKDKTGQSVLMISNNKLGMSAPKFVEYESFFGNNQGKTTALMRINSAKAFPISFMQARSGSRLHVIQSLQPNVDLAKFVRDLKKPTIIKIQFPGIGRDWLYTFEIEPDTLKEGIRSGLAGAALAATTAMTPAAAQDGATEVIRVEVPTPQQQIAQAIRAGEVPRGHQYRARTRNGWVVSVTVDGETYDIRDRIPVAGQRMIAAADQLRQRMQEQELAESEPEDPIARIDSLFRNS